MEPTPGYVPVSLYTILYYQEQQHELYKRNSTWKIPSGFKSLRLLFWHLLLWSNFHRRQEALNNRQAQMRILHVNWSILHYWSFASCFVRIFPKCKFFGHVALFFFMNMLTDAYKIVSHELFIAVSILLKIISENSFSDMSHHTRTRCFSESQIIHCLT